MSHKTFRFNSTIIPAFKKKEDLPLVIGLYIYWCSCYLFIVCTHGISPDNTLSIVASGNLYYVYLYHQFSAENIQVSANSEQGSGKPKPTIHRVNMDDCVDDRLIQVAKKD